MSDSHGDAERDAPPPETPLLVRHVEGHVIFGLLSRRVPLAFLALAGGIASLGTMVFLGGEPFGKDILDTIAAVALPMAGFLGWYFLRHQSLLQQAIAG